jgi:hypothetical protein
MGVQARYVLWPPSRDASPVRARPSRDGAQPDGDDGRRRGDDWPRCDDVRRKGVSPSGRSPFDWFCRIGVADASPMTTIRRHMGSSTYFRVVVKTNGAGSGRSARRASSSSSQSAPGRWSGAMGNKKSRHFLSDKRNPRYDRWSCAIPANTRKSKISAAIRRLAGACTKNKYFFAQGVATTR